MSFSSSRPVQLFLGIFIILLISVLLLVLWYDNPNYISLLLSYSSSSSSSSHTPHHPYVVDHVIVDVLPLRNNNNNDKMMLLTLPYDPQEQQVQWEHSTEQQHQRELIIGDFDYLNIQFFDDNNTIIVLPDSEPKISSSITLSLNNLYCTRVNIGDIDTLYNIYNWNDNTENMSYVPSGYSDTLYHDIIISPFNVDCISNYQYEIGNFGLLKGSGKLIANSLDSIGKMTLSLSSITGFENVIDSIPLNIQLYTCALTLNVVNIDFIGGLDASIFSLLESTVRNVLEEQAKKLICDEMRSKGIDKMTQFLNQTKVMLEDYIIDDEEENDQNEINPLYYEKNVIINNNTTNWFNLQSVNKSLSLSDSAIPQIMSWGISLVHSFFKSTSSIDMNEKEISSNAKGIQTFLDMLKELKWFNMIDDQLEFHLELLNDNDIDNDGIDDTYNDIDNNDMNSTDDNDNTTINNGTRRLLDQNNDDVFYHRNLQFKLVNTTKPIQMDVSIIDIKVRGFETIQSLVPLEIMNNSQYTFNNMISFQQLTFIMQMKLNLKAPNVYEDKTIFYNANPKDYIEYMTISFDVENIQLNASILIGIDINQIEQSLFIGTILTNNNLFDQLLNCVLKPSLKYLDITALLLSFNNNGNNGDNNINIPTIQNLTITGFDKTPGMKRIVPIIMNSILEMIQTTLLKALPGILNGPIKKQINTFLNKEFITTTTTNSPSEECSNPITNTITTNNTKKTIKNHHPYVDFRDLLLKPNASYELGGLGTSPYGTIMPLLYELLQKELLVSDTTNKTDGEDTGLAIAINELLSNFIKTSDDGTNNNKWLLMGSDDLFNKKQKMDAGGLNIAFNIRVYGLYIENINTIRHPLNILSPVNGIPMIVENMASIGTNDKPFRFGISIDLTIISDDEELHNDLDLSIGLDQLQVFVSTMFKMNETLFLSFPVQDILNMNCWLAMMPPFSLNEYGIREQDSEMSIGVTDFNGVVNKFMLNINCKNCTGPKLIEAAALLSMDENQDDVTAISNSIFNFATMLIQDGYLQVQLDRAVNEAPKLCPHHSQYVGSDSYEKVAYLPFEVTLPQSSMSFIVGLMIVCVTLIALVVSMRCIIIIVVRRRHQKWIETLNKDQLLILYKSQNDNKELETHNNTTTSSMMTSRSVPLSVRLSMPIIILGNIGFFLSGHLSLGASVSLIFSFGGQTIRSDDFFSFSMAKSTIEIWNAGGQALAIMIFVASFAWPYSKQLMTLVIWFAPPRMITVKTRGNTLLWLDALAKWSIIDIFVLVVTIVCLRVSIKSPSVPYLPSSLYQIDLLVIPKWGLYANLIAQLISQVSSHYIIYYHRRIVKDAFISYQNRKIHHQQQQQQQQKPEEQQQETFASVRSSGRSSASIRSSLKGSLVDVDFQDIPINPTLSDDEEHSDSMTETSNPHVPKNTRPLLCDHAFRRFHRGEADKIMVRRFVNPWLMFLTLSTAILFVFGSILPTFTVTIYGIVGVVVESGQAFVSAQVSYSIFTVMGALFDQAQVTGSIRDYIGLGSLSIICILTVLFVPIAQSLTLVYMWLKPLSERKRKRFVVIIEILQAWQYAEVYLISVIIASWQLGPISEYMINPYCKSLGGLFAQLAFYGVIKEEDAQCMKTDIAIEPYFYFLFVGCLVLAIINTFVMTAVTQYFRDMDAKCISNIENGNDDDDKIAAATVDDDDDSIYTSQVKNNANLEVIKSSILPTPVMFTDRFRWFLRREDSVMSTKGKVV